MPQVHVRRFDDRSIVKTVDCTCPVDSNSHNRLLMGMLRNLNQQDYYLDDGGATRADTQDAPQQERA